MKHNELTMFKSLFHKKLDLNRTFLYR